MKKERTGAAPLHIAGPRRFFRPDQKKALKQRGFKAFLQIIVPKGSPDGRG